jgi:hypothetical protein
MYVLWNSLFRWGPLQCLSADFAVNWINRSPISKCNALMGKARVWRRLCHMYKATCLAVFSCTPENIARVLASVGHSLRWSACKLAHALGMSDRSVGASCLVSWTFTNTNCKLCMLEWSGQRGTTAVLSSISWILTKNPDLPNNC